CLAAPSALLKLPLHSATTPMSTEDQSSFSGSGCDQTGIFLPLTAMKSGPASTWALKSPKMESYLSRWASMAGAVMSLTATISKCWFPSAARKTFRPMRPKPLIPTRSGMHVPPRKLYQPSADGMPPATVAAAGRIEWAHGSPCARTLPGGDAVTIRRRNGPRSLVAGAEPVRGRRGRGAGAEHRLGERRARHRRAPAGGQAFHRRHSELG